MRGAIAVLLVTAISTGCAASRVTLRPAPEATAPEAERCTALRDLTPVGELLTPGRVLGVPTLRTDGLILKNGARVFDPRDLQPVVDPLSPTVLAATAYGEKAETAMRLNWIALGVFATSMATTALMTMQPAEAQRALLMPELITIGFGTLASVVLWVVAGAHSFGAQMDREEAFRSYPRDLTFRLGLEQTSCPAPVEEPAATR